MATSPGARGWLFGRVTVPATGGKGGGRGEGGGWKGRMAAVHDW